VSHGHVWHFCIALHCSVDDDVVDDVVAAETGALWAPNAMQTVQKHQHIEQLLLTFSCRAISAAQT
jgi:hypothetical protein